jgi:3'-5' exonuclease
MSTLVIVIKTVGETWESFDTVMQAELLNWVSRSAQDASDYAHGERQVKKSLSYSPFTGRIVAIGLYDCERAERIVYAQGIQPNTQTTDGCIYKARTEREMLQDFWEGVQTYERCITYGGRSFVVPFLIIRSAIHGIRPTIDLMERRYVNMQHAVQHIDLQDQLLFYGAVRRKMSLHVVTRAFQIESDPSQGSHHETIDQLYTKGQFIHIAQRTAQDAYLVNALYEKWHTYLAPLDLDTPFI